MAQDWTSFTLSIAIKSDLATIYNAWTKSSEIEKWFLETCKYSNTAQNQNVIAPGDYQWTWYLYEPVEQGKITQANRKDFFSIYFCGRLFGRYST